MSDQLKAKVEVADLLESREMQAELLAKCVLALGMVVSASGMRGMQIILEVDNSELTVHLAPSDTPGDGAILQAIGGKVKSGGILRPGPMGYTMALH
jgi:hypothetical protein